MKNILKIITSFFIMLVLSISSTAQVWQWAKTGNDKQGVGQSLKIGRNGKIYIWRDYYDLNNIRTQSKFSRFEMNGIKSKEILPDVPYPSGAIGANLLYIDTAERIYMVGATKDNVTLANINLPGGKYGRGYLLRIDSNLSSGELLKQPWVSIIDLTMDEKGHTYICGEGSKSPPSTLDAFSFQNTNHYPFYVAGLDTTFKAEWLKQSFGGDAGAYECAIVGENLYVWAAVDSCLTYDTLHNCSDYYTYLMNCDKKGNLKWYLHYSPQTPNGYARNGIYGLGTDKLGNCYFSGTVSTATMEIEGNIITKQSSGFNSYDGLFGKVDSNGIVQWIKPLHVTNSIAISKIVSPNNSNIYCFGIFTGTATIGGFTISTTKTDDYFIARFDSSGTCIGAMALPSAIYNDFGVDKDGSLVFTGTYYGSVTFGGIPLTVGAGLGHDFFVAKLSNLTGIEEAATIKKGILRIYANPSQGNFKIEIPEDLQLNKTAKLQITDALGKLLKDETILVSQSTLEIALGIVPKGVYYVSLKQEQLYYTGNVVVE
jgi:hypothetical protein